MEVTTGWGERVAVTTGWEERGVGSWLMGAKLHVSLTKEFQPGDQLQVLLCPTTHKETESPE